MITVGAVNGLLQDAQKNYRFPPDALTKVCNEMLGCSLEEVDPNLNLEISAFMENLKQQFEFEDESSSIAQTEDLGS